MRQISGDNEQSPSIRQDSDLDRLLTGLHTLEDRWSGSALGFPAPSGEDGEFLWDLCDYYVGATDERRRALQDAVVERPGVQGRLLGCVYAAAEHVREMGDRTWVIRGFAAAALRRGSPLDRDYLLGLADLYVSAEEAGFEPQVELQAADLTIPADFETYAVVRSRRRLRG